MKIDVFSFALGFLFASLTPFIDIIAVSIIRKRMSNDGRNEERVGE